uniref:Uncharacterized protein n=1 Tax=Calidris pygmaea TaxID=425635 RepID=A0A8C3PH48_9CHAR
MTDCLTSVKSVNKTDALSLLTTFGSLAAVVAASREDLSLCPGVGPQKVSGKGEERTLWGRDGTWPLSPPSHFPPTHRPSGSSTSCTSPSSASPNEQLSPKISGFIINGIYPGGTGIPPCSQGHSGRSRLCFFFLFVTSGSPGATPMSWGGPGPRSPPSLGAALPGVGTSGNSSGSFVAFFFFFFLLAGSRSGVGTVTGMPGGGPKLSVMVRQPRRGGAQARGPAGESRARRRALSASPGPPRSL